MSGFPMLRPITKECCASAYGFKLWRIFRGKDVESPHFTCPSCGQAYEWRTSGWEPMSTLEDLKAMVANDPRGHLEIEE